MRRYRGFIADNARWDRIRLRSGDVVVATPSKCGTTWMQTIVTMLLHDRVEIGRPLGLVAPWVEMQTRPLEEIVDLLEAQDHRRCMKSHTALDGIPWSADVTYVVVVRHPLDAALSDRDHRQNMDADRTLALRTAAVGTDDGATRTSTSDPADAVEFLRGWIDSEAEPAGTGTASLGDFANSVRTYWAARHRPNVHLFHYSDLVSNRDREMRRVAAALSIPIDEARWGEFVDAASFEAMRSRAGDLAPEAHLGLWHSDEAFFREGRSAAWIDVLPPNEVDRFERRLDDLVGPEAAAWVRVGGPAG